MGAKSPEEEHPQKAFGWAARDSSGVLSPFNFSRRANGEEDVTIKILFCGICHTDLHLIKEEVGMTIYPIVPGHEITGVITQVGCNVQRLQVGDKVGVGCLVGACHECDNCNQWMENFCPKRIRTYNSIYNDGTITYGGYSDYLVVHHRYVVCFPENVPLDAGAPLLCAGITVYSPMRGFGIDKPGMHLGVVGLGGLGHVAVKFGKALGMKITVISTSPSKETDAIKRLGADGFLVSSNLEQMQAASGTMDGIINTAVAPHLISPLVDLLKNYGKLIMLAGTQKPSEIPILQLLMGRKTVAGSAIGGLKETQEMIDFAGKHNITADVEVIPMDYVNTAMERLAKGDVHYRFVIDVANTMAAESTHPSRLHARG